jgi:hypothetical protein
MVQKEQNNMTMHRTTCCGIREYEGISEFKSVKKVIDDMAKEILYNMNAAIVTFSNSVSKKSRANIGYKIQTYINENKLGTVNSTQPKFNPNSSHYIVMWIWTINPKALRFWFNNRHPNYVTE